MITRTISRQNLPRIFLLFMMLLHGSISSSLGNDPNPMQKRLELSQKLDSLEVEKQSLKRQGESIAELEQATRILRDSLLTLRHTPARNTRTPSAPDPLAFRPRSTLDWIITGTGLVAAISVVILIIGMLRTRREKRRRMTYTYTRRLKPLTKQLKTKDTKAAEEEAQKPFIPPTSDQFSKRIEQERVSPPPQADTDRDRAETSDDGLITLRQRLLMDTPPQEKRSARPVIPEAPPQTSPMSFNDLVIKAANEGLSIQEISRRYQISIDQVTLILKIAGQK